MACFVDTNMMLDDGLDSFVFKFHGFVEVGFIPYNHEYSVTLENGIGIWILRFWKLP